MNEHGEDHHREQGPTRFHETAAYVLETVVSSWRPADLVAQWDWSRVSRDRVVLTNELRLKN